MPSSQMQKVIQHFRSVLRRRETAGQPDGDLLTRYVRDGDEAAFEALVHRHGPMVLGVCRRVLRNLHDAELCTLLQGRNIRGRRLQGAGRLLRRRGHLVRYRR